jgi:large subunit ribosomal protein L32e
MSKKFKSQDYFRYKKLGKRWRRPKGLQSKLRIRKGGSGMRVSIGYRSPAITRNKTGGLDVITVYNADDLTKVGNNIALIASAVGAKKALEIEEKAKQLEVRILNMKKVRRAKKLGKALEKKRAEKKKTKEKKEEQKEDKTAEVKKESRLQESKEKESKTETKAEDKSTEKDTANENKNEPSVSDINQVI